MDFSDYFYKLHLNIGKLSESSLKHRSAILMLSVLMLFIEPNVAIIFGSASVAGLGISVNPPQEIPVGLFLLTLLLYRLIAFWALVLTESGTDSSRAERKALLEFDPSWEAEETRTHDLDQLIRQESGKTIYKWSIRQLVWEFVIPNLLAFIALVVYVVKYVAL